MVSFFNQQLLNPQLFQKQTLISFVCQWPSNNNHTKYLPPLRKTNEKRSGQKTIVWRYRYKRNVISFCSSTVISKMAASANVKLEYLKGQGQTKILQDPLEFPVTIIGQLSNLNKVQFDDVKSRFASCVDEKVKNFNQF